MEGYGGGSDGQSYDHHIVVRDRGERRTLPISHRVDIFLKSSKRHTKPFACSKGRDISSGSLMTTPVGKLVVGAGYKRRAWSSLRRLRSPLEWRQNESSHLVRREFGQLWLWSVGIALLRRGERELEVKGDRQLTSVRKSIREINLILICGRNPTAVSSKICFARRNDIEHLFTNQDMIPTERSRGCQDGHFIISNQTEVPPKSTWKSVYEPLIPAKTYFWTRG
jgi:hypothetical protein